MKLSKILEGARIVMEGELKEHMDVDVTFVDPKTGCDLNIGAMEYSKSLKRLRVHGYPVDKEKQDCHRDDTDDGDDTSGDSEEAENMDKDSFSAMMNELAGEMRKLTLTDQVRVRHAISKMVDKNLIRKLEEKEAGWAEHYYGLKEKAAYQRADVSYFIGTEPMSREVRFTMDANKMSEAIKFFGLHASSDRFIETMNRVVNGQRPQVVRVVVPLLENDGTKTNYDLELEFFFNRSRTAEVKVTE